MSEIGKHYKLVKEHPQSYEIHDERDKKNFHVAKRELNLAMHAKLSKIQKFDDGGMALPVSTPVDEAQASVQNIASPEFLNQTPANYPVQSNVLPSMSGMTLTPEAALESNPMVNGVTEKQWQEAHQKPAATAPTVDIEPTRNVDTQPTTEESTIPNQPSSDFGMPSGNLGGFEEQYRKSAEALQEQNRLLGVYYADAEANRTALDEENKNLTKAIADYKVDPNKWVKDQGIIGGIANGLAVILGGIGAGLQHSTTNQAMEFINRQIANDMEAQKAELGKTQNLLSLNMQKYGNLNAATQAYTSQMLAITQGKVQQYAAENPAQAKQAALLHQELGLKIAALNTEIGLKQAGKRAAALAYSNGNPGTEAEFMAHLNTLALTGNKEMYDDLQKRVVPSVGVAKIALSEKDRDYIANLSVLQKYAKASVEFREKNSGSWGSWTPATKRQGKVLQDSLIGSLQQLLQSNRPVGDAVYERVIKAVGDINKTDFMGGNLSGLKQLQEDIVVRYKNELTHKGMSLFLDMENPSLKPEHQKVYREAMSILAKNPADKNALFVLKKLGVQ